MAKGIAAEMGTGLQPERVKDELVGDAGLENGKLEDPGANLDRKFWTAMALYAILAALAWVTIGPGKFLVQGYSADFQIFGHSFALRMEDHWVELRLLPMIVLGGFALRTVLVWQADRIRREKDNS